MQFSHIVRRLHLYLGVFLIAWFFMYGVTSLPFAHPAAFGSGRPERTLRFDRPYSIELPEKGDLRPIGAQIMRDAGMEGAFGTYRDPQGRLHVYRYDFRSSTEITYFPREKRLLAEDNRFRWSHFLTGLHARGGFEQESVLNTAWGILVDIVCVAILLWIATGIYMWWQVRGHRGWGWLALAGGALSFAVVLLGL
jgi:hypothetical protein